MSKRSSIRLGEVVIVHHPVSGREAAQQLKALLQPELPSGIVLGGLDQGRGLDALEALLQGAGTVLMVLSEDAMREPLVLLQLAKAVHAEVPIVALQLPGYELVPSAAFLARLDSRLTGDDAAILRRRGLALNACAWLLSTAVPAAPTVKCEGEGGGLVTSEIANQLLTIMINLPPLKIEGTLEAWLKQRDRPLKYHPPDDEHEAEPSADPRRDLREHSGEAGTGAAVPALAPELPEGYEESTPSRLALLHEAKHVALSSDFSGCRKISLRGTGGAGKTTLATALVRDVDMLAGFDVAAWVTASETPDLVECVRTALTQLGGTSDGVELDALRQALRDRARRRNVLLVLDDVWQSEHAQLLCALDEETRSVCLVSTRLTKVLRSAVELHVGLMATSEAAALLLRVAKKPELVASPPPAALRVVEQCDRLPLLLYMAGAMIEQYDGADWASWIVQTLSGEHQEALREKKHVHVMDAGSSAVSSLEERIIGSSLRSACARDKAGVVRATFLHFAIFPEDTPVPAAVFDALAETIVAAAASGQSVKGKPASTVRKALVTLLSCSLVQGSLNKLSQHDIVRGYTLVTVRDSVAGGMRAMQRHGVKAMLLALEEKAPAKELQSYAIAHLAKHVADAKEIDGPRPSIEEADRPDALGGDVLRDEMLSQAMLNHPSDDVRTRVGRGLGLEQIRAAAGRCETQHEWMLAAKLWWSASLVSEVGKDRFAGYECVQRVSPPTVESVTLEAKLVKTLLVRSGGFKAGDDGHLKAAQRLGELKAVPEFAKLGVLLMADGISTTSSSYQVYLSSCSERQPDAPSLNLEPKLRTLWPYVGQMANGTFGGDKIAEEGYARLQVAPCFTAVHALPAYDCNVEYGKNGALIRQVLSKYDFDAQHESLKAVFGREPASSGIVGSLLLLFWADADAAKADWESATERWQKVNKRLELNKTTHEKYALHVCETRAARAVALACDEVDYARKLFECTPDGAVFRDGEKAHEAQIREHLNGVRAYTGTWRIAASLEQSTYVLMCRATGTLLMADGPKQKAALRGAAEWLPAPSSLLEMAERETAWDVWLTGAQHPALVCGLLYARLQRWNEAEQVAAGLPRRSTQPLLRIEALRLRARCRRAAADPAEAAKHVAAARSEAERARYAGLLPFIAMEEQG